MGHTEAPDRRPDVAIVVEPRESVAEGLIRAAKRAGVEPYADPSPLFETIDVDALERIMDNDAIASSRRRPVVVLTIWGRTFVVTPAEIEVYEPASGSEGETNSRPRRELTNGFHDEE